MSSFILNFDTVFANYLPVSGSSSSFVASFPLQQPLRKIVRISLVSLEMPVQFANVRTSISFSYTKTAGIQGTFSISINQTFVTIASLLSYINSQIPTISGVTIVFSVSSTNNYQIIATTTGLTAFSLANYNDKTQFLKNILGYNGTETLAGGGILTAANFYNLNLDNFITMYLSNIPHQSTNQNLTFSSFKVPLNAVSNTIYYFGQNGSYTPFINVTDSNFVLEKLNVTVYDRFGNSLNSNGGDFSFSLRIDTAE